MNSKHDQRPMSPYMLGPYYKFQITSFLSIVSRVTGIFMAVVTAPLAILWFLGVMLGEDAYAAMTGFLGSWYGQLLVLASLFSLVYHLLNGLRHLAWDAGKGFEMSQIKATGYLVVIATLLSVAGIWWAAS
jgi:succinate dehydrogenase / fumarate reductase cytochrome b subunit